MHKTEKMPKLSQDSGTERQLQIFTNSLPFTALHIRLKDYIFILRVTTSNKPLTFEILLESPGFRTATTNRVLAKIISM